MPTKLPKRGRCYGIAARTGDADDRLAAGHSHIDRVKYASASGVAKGAYVLADPPDGCPEVLLLGTGSEVPLCVQAHEKLARRHKKSCRQYAFLGIVRTTIGRLSALGYSPDVIAWVSVEQASVFGWGTMSERRAIR